MGGLKQRESFAEDMIGVHLSIHGKILDRKGEIDSEKYERLMELLANRIGDTAAKIIRGDF